MFTIHDMRRLANADPKNLPTLIVHAVSIWKAGARIGRTPDGKLQVHMNVSSYLGLCRELPLERVRRLSEHSFEAKIALEPHHLLGGIHDRERPAPNDKVRRGDLREMLGFDRTTAAPKIAEVAETEGPLTYA